MSQNIINVKVFSILDVLAGDKFVLAGGRHLIKPSELVVAFILSLGSILDDHIVNRNK